MSKTYIAVIGIVDELTTEEIPLKEIAVNARDVYEAHKNALFKCNLGNNETVFKIKDGSSKAVVFEHRKGFVS